MAFLRWQQNITDGAGNVIPGASVEIRDEETGSLVSLFSDRNGTTPLGNPITADADGYAFAYLESTRFRVTASDGVDSFTWRDLRLADNSSEVASEVVVDHVAESNPHEQYARLSGGAEADFTDMPQVGGDPIVESGSNSDGEWTRWADGTATFYKRNAYSGTYGDIVIDLPIAFTDTDFYASANIIQSAANLVGRFVTVNSNDNTAESIKVALNGSVGSGSGFDVYGQGRWK